MPEKVYQFKVTDKELQDFLDSQPNKSDFFRQVAQDLKDGKLVYLSESIDAKIKIRRYDKLAKEMLKLDIDNRIRLIREMKLSPSEVIEITSGRRELEVGSIVETTNNNLSPSQWDWVYGSMSRGYKKDNDKKICEIPSCGFECDKDETLRKHIIDNHSLEISAQIKALEKFGVK